MTFMIPTPATASDTEAMPASARVSARMIDENAEIIASWLITVTSSARCRSTKKAEHVVPRLGHLLVHPHLDEHAEERGPVEHPHGGTDRDEHEVVEVEPEAATARREHADDPEPPRPDPNDLAERVLLRRTARGPR